MYNCRICNTPNRNRLCQRCRRYLHLHPEGCYPLPPKGTLAFAPNGDPICPLCGEAHRKLGNHLAFYHHIPAKEARLSHNLQANTRISHQDYIQHMHNLNKEQPTARENLEKGASRRYKKGDTVPGRGKHKKITRVTYSNEVKLDLKRSGKEDNYGQDI